jgi:hypothetical protein
VKKEINSDCQFSTRKHTLYLHSYHSVLPNVFNALRSQSLNYYSTVPYADVYAVLLNYSVTSTFHVYLPDIVYQKNSTEEFCLSKMGKSICALFMFSTPQNRGKVLVGGLILVSFEKPYPLL